MELKLMNIMDESYTVNIPDGFYHIDILNISGDEVAEVYYPSNKKTFDISDNVGIKRSEYLFWDSTVLFDKNKNINYINKYNSRVNQKEEWWK